MSALHRIIHRARLQRHAKAQRKLAKKHAVVRRSKFFVESLEPRLLLSGDVVPAPLMADLNEAAEPAPIVSTYDPAEAAALPKGTVGSELATAPQLLDSDTAAVAGDNNDTLTIAPQLLDETPIRVSDANNQPTEGTPLELAPVNRAAHWVGGSGNWSDPTHWDIGVVPNNDPAFNYQITIAATGNPTITVDQNITIDTLNNAATIQIADGVGLTVGQQTTNSGSIQLIGNTSQLNLSGTINNTGQILAPTGKLNVSNATLNVTGGSAQVLASGTATTLTNVNLSATGGGQILLPAATSVTTSTSASALVVGAGSKIDLSGLTSFVSGASGSLTLNPLIGGELTLAGAISGRTTITVSDTTGMLKVDGVTSLQDSAVTVSNGRILNFSSLTQLARVSLSATSGAKILFPVVVGYTDGAQASYTIQASGMGSKIDLSHLTSMAGSNSSPFGNTLSIAASGGGEVDLGGAITGTTVITLSDATSILNVAAVTSLQDIGITVSNSGTLNFAALTTLTRVNLTATTGGRILFPVATTYVDGAQASYTIQASGMGSKIDLSHLTSMAGSNSSPFGNTLSIAASGGGEVDLAGAITGTTVITLSDATSILNVAAVTSLQDSGVNASNGATLNFSSLTKLTRVNIVANSGAQILFPTATTYVDGAQANYSIQASGVGSKIDLSHLTSMAGSNSSPFGNTLAITASGGGEVDLAGAITGTIALTLSDPNSVLNLAAVTGLSGVTLTASNGAVLNVANVISLQDTAINASNGTMLNFLTLTQLARVSLSATSGAKILFPVVVGYTDGAQASYTIQASGMGSKIDLSHLTSMAGSNSSPFGNTLSIAASGGGEVDLAGAITGTTVITLSDATSILNVAAVTSLQDIGITVSNSGTLNFAALTTLTRVNLTATTGGRILFPVATTYVDGAQASYTIQASGMGSKIDLSHLTSMAGSNSSPFGNTLSIAASGGGEVDLGGAITGTTVITLSDATSILNVAAVTSLQDIGITVSNSGTLNFAALTTLTRVNLTATTGGRILFPVATTYVDGAQASYTIQASGIGSKIDLSHLTSMAGSNSSPFGNTLSIAASGGGEVDLAGAITGTTVITLSDANSVLNLAAVTDLSGVTLTASNGAVFILPLGWTPTVGSGVSFTTSTGGQFVNLANLNLAGATLNINTSAFTDKGVLNARTGGTFDINGSFRVDDSGTITGAGGTFNVSGDFLGDTRNADLYGRDTTMRFDGAGTLASPQILEVMSQDLGAGAAGYARNFSYLNLTLANNTRVKLVDLSDNATGAGSEALYVNTLNVPTGATLDLNGINLYIRTRLGTGTIIPNGGTVNSAPPNNTPAANNDAASTNEDTPVEIDVVANDIDPDPTDQLLVSTFTNPAHGTVKTGPGRILTYTPAPDYNGSDSFTYTVSDGNGGLTNATVSVTINAVPDAPRPKDDFVATAMNQPVTIPVLANDNDPDILPSGGKPTLLEFDISQPTLNGGRVTKNPDNTLTYTPRTDFTGIDTFIYMVRGVSDLTATATVTVVVTQPFDVIPPQTLATARVGQPYSQPIVTRATPTEFKIVRGALPPGLNLTLVPTSAPGLEPQDELSSEALAAPILGFTLNLTGTPTGTGTYIFTVLVNDQFGSCLETIKVTVNPADNTLRIGDTATLDAEVGVPYKDSMSITGGNPFTGNIPRYAVELVSGALPDGLKLMPAGNIIGTPEKAAQTSKFTAEVTDQSGSTYRVELSIRVVAPVSIANEPITAIVGSNYNFQLRTNGGYTPVIWTANLPAGLGLVINPETGVISGTPLTPGIFAVTITVKDALNGSAKKDTQMPVKPFIVTSFTHTASGFTAHFNEPFAPSSLNLYDTESGGFGAADVTLVGATQGVIHGSLVMNQARDEITFIQTGGVLAPDIYTVTLRSTVNGFNDINGAQLDGNGDNIPGDNYTTTFKVDPSNAVVVSIPDVARGARQPVDTPATSAGIPITVSNGAGVTSVKLTLNYDPALLTINNVIAVPPGSQVQVIHTVGQVQITFTSPTPFSAGVVELVKLTASVPTSVLPGATYGFTELLHITNLLVNNGTIDAVGDDGLHVAAYFGDATGNGDYSSLDAQRVLRVAAGLDSGFAAYRLVDPVIIGDITGNGLISSLDATRILQEVAGLDRPEIPPLPTPAAPAPTESMSTADTATPSAAVTNSEVPLLTNDTTVKSADVAAVTNSLSENLTLDIAQSDALSKGTGKEWLFYTI